MVRISVNITDTDFEHIKTESVVRNCAESAVVITALYLERLLSNLVREGSRILIKDVDGTTSTLELVQILSKHPKTIPFREG